MSLITINCSIDLTEEELLFVLRRRAGQIITVSPPEETAAAASVGPILTPEQLANIAREEEELAAAHASIDVVEPVVQAPAEPPPLPPKPTRRASRVNGAAAGGEVNSTPIASPPVNRLDEASMRALLSKVGAVHPLKVKAITNILENCGGARRLSECDPATWPVIAEEAEKVLAEYAP
jgi:hypothetical protein